jgi:hypothetical protein
MLTFLWPLNPRNSLSFAPQKKKKKNTNLGKKKKKLAFFCLNIKKKKKKGGSGQSLLRILQIWKQTTREVHTLINAAHKLGLIQKFTFERPYDDRMTTV